MVVKVVESNMKEQVADIAGVAGRWVAGVVEVQLVVEVLLAFHNSDKNSLELGSHTSGNLANLSLYFLP